MLVVLVLLTACIATAVGGRTLHKQRFVAQAKEEQLREFKRRVAIASAQGQAKAPSNASVEAQHVYDTVDGNDANAGRAVQNPAFFGIRLNQAYEYDATSSATGTTTHAVPQGSSPPGDAALHTVPAYRALGKAQYGRSDFTAPNLPYDRRCSATGANPAMDGATSLRPAYEVADADGASLPSGAAVYDPVGSAAPDGGGSGVRVKCAYVSPQHSRTCAEPVDPRRRGAALPGLSYCEKHTCEFGGCTCHKSSTVQHCQAHQQSQV